VTPVSSHSPHGQSPLRTVQVLGGGNAGSSAHVRSLTSGLVARAQRAPCTEHHGLRGAPQHVRTQPAHRRVGLAEGLRVAVRDEFGRVAA